MQRKRAFILRFYKSKFLIGRSRSIRASMMIGRSEYYGQSLHLSDLIAAQCNYLRCINIDVSYFRRYCHRVHYRGCVLDFLRYEFI